MERKKTMPTKKKTEKTVSKKNKRIAVLTSGGDSPGMNSVIRAVARQSIYHGYECFLIYEGYKGLVEDNFREIDINEIDSLAANGGTFIYTSRLPEFTEVAVRQIAVNNLKKRNIDALVVVGGDGSLKGASALSLMGVNCIALPGTIDNDMGSSEFTIGFYTALETIGKAVQEIRNTCISHNRIGLIEVMGRYCGDLALYGGIASGADLIITCENYMTPTQISDAIERAYKKNPERRTFIIIVSEMLYGAGKNPTLESIAEVIQTVNKKRTNVSRLGYIQRGGMPTTMERVWGTLMGMHAVDIIHDGKKNRVVGQNHNNLIDYSIADAIKMKNPPRIEILKKINRFSSVR